MPEAVVAGVSLCPFVAMCNRRFCWEVNATEILQSKFYRQLQVKRVWPDITHRNSKQISSKQGLLFTSFSSQITQLTKQLKKTTSAAKRKKLKAQLKLAKALMSAGTKACSTISPPPHDTTPALPASRSLDPYTGPWGEKQVRRLLEVFALGGREEDVQRYVQMGVQATVNDLLATKPDDYANSFIDKLSCDTNPDDSTQDCYKNGNINNFYLQGLINGYNTKLLYTANPVQGALWLFAMDERAPGNPRAVNGNSAWMYKGSLDMVNKFASSGDAKQYVLDYATNSFGHGEWLSGKSNHYGFGKAGNQDFGREIMELVSIGTRDPNGNPTYTDLDVEVAARACSGLDETTTTDAQGNSVSVIGSFPDLHYPGQKIIFPGTPYQTSIDTCSDLASTLVTVRKDQYAYELARRLWHRFINTIDTVPAVLKLADDIKANDFKLYPVIGDMMRSKAFYAPESAETILKDPQTYLITFARMMGIPIGNYNDISYYLSDLGMEAGKPPTVFGFSYNKRLLTSDVYQVERFRILTTYMAYQDFTQIKNKFGGWNVFTNIISQIPRVSGDPGTDAAEGLMKRLNLSDNFNSDQKAQFVQFLNYYMGDCDNQDHTGCFMNNGAWKKLYRNAIDLGDNTSDFYRFRLLAVMLGISREFQTM